MNPMNPTDSSTIGILTMVSTGLWSHPDSRTPEEIAADQKREAARSLAPLISAMRTAGLFHAGFKVALTEHMSIDWNPAIPAAPAVRDRLTRARDMMTDRVDLIVLPDAVISYGHWFMPLLGDPRAGCLWTPNDGGSRQLL
jgi:hypothetical protein